MRPDRVSLCVFYCTRDRRRLSLSPPSLHTSGLPAFFYFYFVTHVQHICSLVYGDMRHVASTTVDTIYRVFRSYPHWMKIPSNGIYVNVCDGTPHTHDLHDAHMRKCATDQTRILPPLPHSRCRSLAGGPTCPHATHDLVRSRRPHALSSGRIRIPPADMRPAASRPKQRSTARAAPMCRRGPLKSRVRRVVSRRPAQDIVFSTFSRTCR